MESQSALAPLVVDLYQWLPSGEEFLPREEFHEFRGDISTLYLRYIFIVSAALLF